MGNVYYNAHPASPLVIGDFQIMKGWKGNDDNEVIDIGTGKVFVCDLDLVAPEVFVKGNEVVLMTEMDSAAWEAWTGRRMSSCESSFVRRGLRSPHVGGHLRASAVRARVAVLRGCD